MAQKKNDSRVELIATSSTIGAAQGARARPLLSDAQKWLDMGWRRVAQPEETAPSDPEQEP